MTRILALTGATGFAGGHILREAVARGWQVRALVREPVRAKLPGHVERVVGELSNAEALARLAAGSDCVIHVAGAIAARDRHSFFSVNAEGTANVANAAERAVVRRFVYISSLAARQPELSAYAASKEAGESAARRHPGAAILRPPAVYGPGDRGILPIVQQLTQSTAFLPGHPKQRFSLLYAEDLARVVLAVAEDSWTGLRDVDDGTRGGYDWNNLITHAAQAEGSSIRPVFLPRAAVSMLSRIISAGAQLTGRPAMLSPGKVAELYHHDWVAQDPITPPGNPIRFAEGFRLTVAWYRQHGWLPERRPADTRPERTRQDKRAR
jgi:nucleoside-diphosphate-sugar epimerase